MSTETQDRKPLSIAKHVFGFWIFTPIVFALMGYALFSAIDAPTGERNSVVLLSVVFGLMSGWLVGLVVYLLRNGIRGWAKFGTQMQGQYTEMHDAAARDGAIDDAVEYQHSQTGLSS